MLTRRSLLAGAAALTATPALAGLRKRPVNPAFPAGFLWGAATAAHQVEGNNSN